MGEFEDLDVTWYAVDQTGAIAVFWSAGSGFIPDFVSLDAIKPINQYFSELKVTSNCLPNLAVREHLHGKKLPKTAISICEKGLFVFDALTPNGFQNPYYKLATPSSSLNVGSLSAPIQNSMASWLLPIKFQDISTKIAAN